MGIVDDVITAGFTVLFGGVLGIITLALVKERLYGAVTVYINSYLASFLTDVQKDPAKYAGLVNPLIKKLIADMAGPVVDQAASGGQMGQFIDQLPLPKRLKGLAKLAIAFKDGFKGEKQAATSNTHPLA